MFKTPKGPPKIGALSRTTRLEIPKRAGLAEPLGHIYGFGPRKQKRMSSSPGTNPVHPAGQLGGMNLKRHKGGLTQHTAPYKHELTADGNDIVAGVMGPGMGEPV